jgi:hypothetical protein
VDQADLPDQPDPRALGADEPEQVRDPPIAAEPSDPRPLFRFAQFELPWALGPPDGRYLLRAEGDPPDAAPAHVLVIATLGAPERRRLQKHKRQAEPEPEPEPVVTGRATVIEVGEPLRGNAAARAWLATAGEPDLAAGLAVLNRALHAFRLVTADPYLTPVDRSQTLVARIGYGAGEQVADGLWTEASELSERSGRRRRSAVLAPQARLAAALSGRELSLASQELTLRARLDLDHGRSREAALQVLVALDAALAELALDPTADALADRLAELRGRREQTAGAAQAALAGALDGEQLEGVEFTLKRLEAVFRARAVANA